MMAANFSVNEKSAGDESEISAGQGADEERDCDMSFQHRMSEHL
jgi:hypothetical protein